uniref:Nematode cuticle collagen N-terminal domain-containing protein n=1 Tax=Acrobeloides nanus TaxID=290746 RepID=A0A914ECH0_9BILA
MDHSNPKMSSEGKFLVSLVASFLTISIVGVLMVMPGLFSKINESNLRVQYGVQVFKVETDAAWTQLMDV